MSLVFVTGILLELKKNYEVVLLSSPGPEWEEIHRLYPDIHCIEVNMERRISLIRDLQSLWRLWRIFRYEKPQMVHSMTPESWVALYDGFLDDKSTCTCTYIHRIAISHCCWFTKEDSYGY